MKILNVKDVLLHAALPVSIGFILLTTTDAPCVDFNGGTEEQRLKETKIRKESQGHLLLADYCHLVNFNAVFRGNDRDIDKNIQIVFSDNNTVLEPVKLNDHNGLEIIDVFAKYLKSDIIPNDAILDPEKWTHVIHLNILKSEKNRITNYLNL